MSIREYIHVFESILIAAIVTQILVGWSKMIVQRGTYKIYWLHLLITVNTLILLVQRYYSYRTFFNHELLINSLTFLVIIIIPLSLVFMSVFVLFPKSCEGVDYKEIVVKNRIIIGLAAISIVGITLFHNIVRLGTFQFMFIVPHIILILLWAWFMISKNLRIAAIVSVFGSITLCYFLWYR